MQMVAANPRGEAKAFIRIHNSDFLKTVLKSKPQFSETPVILTSQKRTEGSSFSTFFHQNKQSLSDRLSSRN